jgi:hypothetical protein
MRKERHIGSREGLPCKGDPYTCAVHSKHTNELNCESAYLVDQKGRWLLALACLRKRPATSLHVTGALLQLTLHVTGGLLQLTLHVTDGLLQLTLHVTDALLQLTLHVTGALVQLTLLRWRAFV